MRGAGRKPTMNNLHNTSPQAWCTASCSDASKSSGTDLLLLENHLGTCPQMHQHLLTLHGVAESIHGFVATRFVTTLVIVAVTFSFVYWLF